MGGREVIAWVPPRPGAAPEPVARTAPELGPDDLLVAVEAAVVAAPELRAIDEGSGRAPGGAAVGQVVAAGAAAGDHLGWRVLVGPLAACGECETCRRGRLAACPRRTWLGRDVDGALASHVVARRRWVCPLTGPLAGVAPGPEAALLAREAPLAYAMIARAGVAPGEVTVWVGGPSAATRFGAELARAAGAAAVALPPGAAEPVPALLDAVQRQVEAPPPPATWKIFETSGTAQGRRRAAALAATGATLVLFSGDGDGGDLPLAAALAAEATVHSVAAPHPDLVPEVAALCSRGELGLAGAARLYPFAALPRVVDELRRGAGDDRPAIVVTTMAT